MSRARTRLIVLFGGQSAEHDVSCTSARHVLAAVDSAKYSVEAIGINRDGSWVRADDAMAALEGGGAALPATLAAVGPPIDSVSLFAGAETAPPVVLPVLHGPQGEDGTIQGLLELANVAYVGAGVLASALCMDKIKSKEVLAGHGIAQARWRGFHAGDVDPDLLTELTTDLGPDLFVKPANMGSSVGVSKANDLVELATAVDLAASYDEWIVVEEAIVGREIECGVLGNLDPVASVGAEVLSGADWYDYSDKYDDGAEVVIPADLSATELGDMQALAISAFKALRCEGLARVDFFYEPDGRGWLLNEVNTMPGFTLISVYPKVWAESGVPYPALIDRLVELALDRHSRRAQHRRTDH